MSHGKQGAYLRLELKQANAGVCELNCHLPQPCRLQWHSVVGTLVKLVPKLMFSFHFFTEKTMLELSSEKKKKMIIE